MEIIVCVPNSDIPFQLEVEISRQINAVYGGRNITFSILTNGNQNYSEIEVIVFDLMQKLKLVRQRLHSRKYSIKNFVARYLRMVLHKLNRQLITVSLINARLSPYGKLYF